MIGQYLLLLFQVLQVVFEIMAEFPMLKTRGYRLRVNHTLLLRAILLQCGVDEKSFNDIIHILSDSRVIMCSVYYSTF